jgi:hypothetical protein
MPLRVTTCRCRGRGGGRGGDVQLLVDEVDDVDQ